MKRLPFIASLALALSLVAASTQAQAVCNTQTNPTDSVCGPNNNVNIPMPTTNTDGSPLNDFATARVIFGTVTPLCSAQGVPVVGATVRDVGNLGVPPTPLVNTTKAVLLGSLNMPNGQLNISAQVVNAVGTVSGCAPSVAFTFQGKTPSAPGVRVGP